MLAFFQAVLLVLALVALAASVLSLVRLPYWWTRMFDFPRIHIALAALAVLSAYTAVNLATGDMDTFEWIVFGLLALAVVYQLVRIAVYTPLTPVQARRVEHPAHSVRIVVSNVLMDNRDVERWMRVVPAEDPDIIVAIETDTWWAERLRVLGDDYPHRVEVPQDDTYGMVVYSRLPLEDVEVKRLVEDEVPSVWARVPLPDGSCLRLVCVHPRPPRPDTFQDSHLRDAELVLVARAAEEAERPVVVVGDLNDVAWSYTTDLFQRLSGLLDPRRGRGLYATFHADHPLFRYPLDHVFHSADLGLVEMRVLDHVGSDHFPVLAELAYRPDLAQETPEADAGDREHARHLVEHAFEKKAEESEEEERERKEKDV